MEPASGSGRLGPGGRDGTEAQGVCGSRVLYAPVGGAAMSALLVLKKPGPRRTGFIVLTTCRTLSTRFQARSALSCLILSLFCVLPAHAQPVDVVFLLDESGNESLRCDEFPIPGGPTCFQLALDFAEAASQEMNIAPSNVNVGVLLFADSVRIALNLSSDPNAVAATLNGLTLMGGEGCLECGLQSAIDMLNDNGRPGALQAIVAMTDPGVSFESEALSLNRVAAALSQGIHTFVIDIGPPVTSSFVSDMALSGGEPPATNVSDVGAFNVKFSAFAPLRVPALSTWMLGLLALLLVAVTVGVLRRARARPDRSSSRRAVPSVICGLLCMASASALATTPSGPHHQYVLDSLTLPETSAQAAALGFDLDGDLRADNAFGQVLASLAGGIGIQASMDEAIASGQTILLADLQTPHLVGASCAGLTTYLGDNPGTSPCLDPSDLICGQHLDGSTSFDFRADSPLDALIIGDIVSSTFGGGPGQAVIEISLLGTPFTFQLVGAHAEFDATSTDLTQGRIGGGIDPQNDALPAVTAIISTIVARDCMGTAPPCCPAGSDGQTFIDLFDANADCVVDATEVSQSTFIASLLAPDVDLLDGGGAPGSDGVPESLSFGVGFGAVAASFPRAASVPSLDLRGLALLAGLMLAAAARLARPRRGSI